MTARRAGRGYRLRKLVRRNKIAFAAGTMVVLALSGGFGTSTWLFFREARARQEQARLRHAAEVARANEVELREKAQAGETVAHAAVLISHGDIAAGGQPARRGGAGQRPGFPGIRRHLPRGGRVAPPRGRWNDAAKRFAVVAQAIARADRSDTESISIHFVAAAAAIADAGSTEHYERLRQMAADRFSTATNPVIADEVVKSCLIKPADPRLLAKLDPLLKVMRGPSSLGQGMTVPANLMEAWQMLSLSLAAYRQGDFQLAESWARRCLRHPNRIPARNAAVHAVLAMALQREGHPEEARSGIVRGARPGARQFQKTFRNGHQRGWLLV